MKDVKQYNSQASTTRKKRKKYIFVFKVNDKPKNN